MLRKKWVVLWTLWAMRLVRQPTSPVRVRSGLLRGSVAADGSHCSYLGIPYASAGRRLRFQGPSPAPTWNGILDAYDEHIRCIQRFTATTILGSEDNCLTLNVYTPPGRRRERPLPVMVYIHGGGFRDGSGSPFLYGPEYLVKHEVILVTVNYRLEIIGFLCLGIEEAPGNAGLKDQVAALRWVKENIEAFGGDPDAVTLFGESAGSASVFYHLISPMSRGLFQRAIMQSGAAVSPWSFQFEPLDTASALAKQLGHDTKDPHELHRIFMQTPAERLVRARVPRARGDLVLAENVFVPCAERVRAPGERFLAAPPHDLLARGHYTRVPALVGFNSAEGYMFIGKENETTRAHMNFFDSLPRDLTFTSIEEKRVAADAFRKLYMNDEPISASNLEKFAKYAGDSGITYPVVATVGLMLKTSDMPIYTYKFSHDGWMNVVKLLYGFRGAPGATHADELFYLFKLKVTLLHSFLEQDMIEKMTTMWTNFAKFGEPTPAATRALPTRWRPTRGDHPRLLRIDKRLSTEPLWADEALLLWDQIYSKYRRKS